VLRALFIIQCTGLALLLTVPDVFAQDKLEPVRGLVRAVDEALISTELSARILEITHREGEAFSKGDLLVRFDCAKYQSELDAARAEEEFNNIALKNSIELDKRKAVGRFDVAQNRARYNKAVAQAKTLAAQVDECVVSAPFDGRIAEMRAKAYEMSRPGEPLMKIVNTDLLEIELIVPSVWLRWIRSGQKFRVTVDETAAVYDAMVQRIAPSVDSISQTVKIMAVFAEPAADILPGMSLDAQIMEQKAGEELP
jgi:RND family efflux transporter MFP subunit